VSPGIISVILCNKQHHFTTRKYKTQFVVKADMYAQIQQNAQSGQSGQNTKTNPGLHIQHVFKISL